MDITEFYTIEINNRPRTVTEYMKVMETAGLDHMALSGHRLEDMLAHGESMMFSRAGLRRYRTDISPDRLCTRIVSCKGVRAQRYFRFYAGDELVAEGLNESFCISLTTHQIIRAAWFNPVNKPHNSDFSLRRLKEPKETGEPTGTWQVDPQDVDYNGHMHNTRYWDYALEALGTDADPAEMHLQFHREILPDAPFTMYRLSDGCTVVGRQHGEVAFVAQADQVR